MLIDANYGDGSVPIFMAGGWHEEDFSHVGHYEHQPFGMVDSAPRVLVLPTAPLPPRCLLQGA